MRAAGGAIHRGRDPDCLMPLAREGRQKRRIWTFFSKLYVRSTPLSREREKGEEAKTANRAARPCPKVSSHFRQPDPATAVLRDRSGDVEARRRRAIQAADSAAVFAQRDFMVSYCILGDLGALKLERFRNAASQQGRRSRSDGARAGQQRATRSGSSSPQYELCHILAFRCSSKQTSVLIVGSYMNIRVLENKVANCRMALLSSTIRWGRPYTATGRAAKYLSPPGPASSPVPCFADRRPFSRAGAASNEAGAEISSLEEN